ncbi:MAG TPA: hypothetical protein VF677_11905 [Flavobacterium sp.]|jgi:hypothetical protein
MSFQTFVTQRLAAITAMINAIATNAKKIDELPEQSDLNPASKLHVSRDGISESLEVEKIISAINSGLFDTILYLGDITLDGNVVTVPAGARWKIGNINYGNTSDIERTVPFCAIGLTRIDILVANTSNDIILIRGQETASISIRPNTPPNTVLVTEMSVTERTVGTPANPVLGGPFVRKSEKYFADINAPGQNSVRLYGESSYFMISDFYAPFGNLEYLIDYMTSTYVGKSYVFYNNQATNLTIVHNPSGTVANRKYFIFPNNQNFILKPGEQVEFIEHEDGNLYYLGTANVDINNYYTKTEIDTKISSVYKYKGSVATLADLPSSGQVIGDVYDVQTDGSNYAWNGIEWDRLGGMVDMSGKEDTANKSQDVEADKLSTTKYGSIKAIYDWAVAKFQAALRDVSATQSGIVNNNLLQELGGVDKLINGVRIGRGNGNGINNLALGASALNSVEVSGNLSGQYNVAVGINPLEMNTTGFYNSALGVRTLTNNTTGNYNTTIGAVTLHFNTTGNENTAIGAFSLWKNTTASNNTAFGSSSLRENLTGLRNVAVGRFAAVISTGNDNIAVGHAALGNLSTGSGNVVLGSSINTNLGLTTGSNNLIIAPNNGQATGITTGSGNVVIGKVTGLAADLQNTVTIANGVGDIRFSVNTAGLATIPSQTNALIEADASGKAAITKEYVNSIVKPYKVYVALLTQTGTSAPVATVLENTFGGEVMWSHDSQSNYRGTLTGAFTEGKTAAFLQQNNFFYTLVFNRIDNNSFIITTNGPDNILINASIEIRVYN